MTFSFLGNLCVLVSLTCPTSGEISIVPVAAVANTKSVVESLEEAQEKTDIKYIAYGVEASTVPVFLDINSEDVYLPCASEELSRKFLLKPVYHWKDEKGMEVKASADRSVNKFGSLVFKQFHLESSGLYQCSVTYELNRSNYTSTYQFFVTGYHRVLRGLEVRMEFHTGVCNKDANEEFSYLLVKDLVQIVNYLSCEIHKKSATCHWMNGKLPQGQEAMLTIKLMVFPYGVRWGSSCENEQVDSSNCNREKDDRMKEASVRIQTYIEQNRELQFSVAVLPKLYYRTRSFNSHFVNDCKPGFGIENYTKQCSDCCFVCSPGYYGSLDSVRCMKCPTGSYSEHYGERECTECEGNLITSERGSKSPSDCKMDSIRLQLIIYFILVCLFPLFTFAVFYLICTSLYPKSKLAQQLENLEVAVLRRMIITVDGTNQSAAVLAVTKANKRNETTKDVTRNQEQERQTVANKKESNKNNQLNTEVEKDYVLEGLNMKRKGDRKTVSIETAEVYTELKTDEHKKTTTRGSMDFKGLLEKGKTLFKQKQAPENKNIKNPTQDVSEEAKAKMPNGNLVQESSGIEAEVYNQSRSKLSNASEVSYFKGEKMSHEKETLPTSTPSPRKAAPLQESLPLPPAM